MRIDDRPAFVPGPERVDHRRRSTTATTPRHATFRCRPDPGARHGLGWQAASCATCRWISAPPCLGHALCPQVLRTGRANGSTARADGGRGYQQSLSVSKGVGRPTPAVGPDHFNRSNARFGGLPHRPKSFRRDGDVWVVGRSDVAADRPVPRGQNMANGPSPTSACSVA